MPPRSDTRIDWTGHKTEPTFFAKRLANAYMDNSWQSDMSFVLELDNTTIPAHKLIVGAASPVLERCVYGTGSIVNTECVVNIRDCGRSEFEVFLRYIYTGIVDDLNITSAAILLSLAHYFDLHELEIACTKCIDRELTHRNVCETFDLLHTTMGNTEIVDKCFSWIQLEINWMLKNGTLMRMQNQALKKVLEHDVLHIPNEECVFISMLTWADEECTAQHLLPDSINRRKVIDQRLHLVRFGIMSGEEFTRCLSMAGRSFFSENEIYEIMIRIAMGKIEPSTPTHLLCNSRKRMVRFFKYRPIVVDTCEIVVQTNETNSKITILGFLSFNNVVIDESKCNVKYTKIGHQVIFDSPMHFEEDQTCTFHVRVLKTTLEIYSFIPSSMEEHPNISIQGKKVIPISALIVDEGTKTK